MKVFHITPQALRVLRYSLFFAQQHILRLNDHQLQAARFWRGQPGVAYCLNTFVG